MFWKFNPSNPNHIDSLLNKKDVTLKELMDDEDILQECKAQNKNLLEFLRRPEIMEELVTLTTTEPSEELDERTRFKYPNIACELLTCDVPCVNERLAANTTLAKLYQFLESEPPLNPLLASFFSKILGVIVARKTDQHWYSYQFTCLQVLEFLKSKEDSVSNFLKHLGTSAIMDLLLKLITQVEGADMRQNLVNWLESHSVVSSLVALLDPSVDTDRHCNASQLLCKIITKTRENILSSSEPNPLINILKTVESPQTVDQILQCILSSKKSESSIVGGIIVLLTLLGFNKGGNKNDSGSENGAGTGSEFKQEDYQEVIQSTAAAILPYLKDFHNLLLDPPPKAPVLTTVGILDPPLGQTRWHVAKLFSALAATNSPAINQELAQLGTVEVLLDLFFKYQWNNFLHRQVERFLAYALSGTPVASGDGEPPHTVLIENILVQCRLIQRILDAWADNEEVTAGRKEGRRRGYMGHLIIIANNLTKQLETEPIKTIVSEKIPQETQDAWKAFADGPLAEVNKVYESGPKPVIPSNDEDEAYRTVQLLTNATNQGYMTYQSADDSLTSMETFNLRDAERFCGSGLRITGKEDFMRGYEFDSSEPNDRLSELCREFASNLAADDGDVCHWEDTVQLSEFLNKSSKWSNDDISDSHNSDDELDDERERGDQHDDQYGEPGMVVHMEVDTDPWLKGPGAGVMDPLSDPWATSGNDGGLSAEEQSDWADFSKFEANFNLSTTLDDGDNASSNDSVLPFGQAAAQSASVIVPNSELTLDKEEVVSDANANPTSSATIADVTPTAIATVEEVAASAIAAITSVQAAAEDLDNRRFLPVSASPPEPAPEPAPAETAIGDSEAISETKEEPAETPVATEAPSEPTTCNADADAAIDAAVDAPAPAPAPAPVPAPTPTSYDASSSGGCADSSGSGSADSAGITDSGSGSGDCGSGGDSGGSGDCGSCE